MNKIDKRIECVMIHFEPARVEEEIIAHAYRTLIPNLSRKIKQEAVGNETATKERKTRKNDKKSS